MGEAALSRGLILAAGTLVNHSTAHPGPWPCQPLGEDACIAAVVHFISVALSSVLTSPRWAWSCHASPSLGAGTAAPSAVTSSPGEPGQGGCRRLLEPRVAWETGQVVALWSWGLPVPPLPFCPGTSHGVSMVFSPALKYAEPGLCCWLHVL